MTLEDLELKLTQASAAHLAAMSDLGEAMLAAGLPQGPRLWAAAERALARVFLLMDARLEMIASGTVSDTTIHPDSL